MSKLITAVCLLLCIAFTSCGNKANKTDNANTTEPAASANTGTIYPASDLKNIAVAINATAKPEIQTAIDSIQNMDLKYWAIAATVKTDKGLVEAIQKIKNKDVKSAAFAMSGNDSVQGQQMI